MCDCCMIKKHALTSLHIFTCPLGPDNVLVSSDFAYNHQRMPVLKSPYSRNISNTCLIVQVSL